MIPPTPTSLTTTTMPSTKAKIGFSIDSIVGGDDINRSPKDIVNNTKNDFKYVNDYQTEIARALRINDSLLLNNGILNSNDITKLAYKTELDLHNNSIKDFPSYRMPGYFQYSPNSNNSNRESSISPSYKQSNLPSDEINNSNNSLIQTRSRTPSPHRTNNNNSSSSNNNNNNHSAGAIGGINNSSVGQSNSQTISDINQYLNNSNTSGSTNGLTNSSSPININSNNSINNNDHSSNNSTIQQQQQQQQQQLPQSTNNNTNNNNNSNNNSSSNSNNSNNNGPIRPLPIVPQNLIESKALPPYLNLPGLAQAHNPHMLQAQFQMAAALAQRHAEHAGFSTQNKYGHHPPPPPPPHLVNPNLGRESYPLYPWLLSRHGRIFPHGFPGNFLLHPFRKPKRVRTAFSPSQLLKLEHAFESNQYVVGAERKTLAQALNLSETQVKVWFQNRRTKHKRMQQEEDSKGGSGNGSSSTNADHSNQSYQEDELIDMDDCYSEDDSDSPH